MGMYGDYKINECGEIIRNEPSQTQKPNQEPEKKRKGGWIVWLIVMSIAAALILVTIIATVAYRLGFYYSNSNKVTEEIID